MLTLTLALALALALAQALALTLTLYLVDEKVLGAAAVPPIDVDVVHAWLGVES